MRKASDPEAHPLSAYPLLRKHAIVTAEEHARVAAKAIVYEWEDIACAGNIVALAGHPGGGKTTLLYMMVAARRNRTDKRLSVLGREMRPGPEGEVHRPRPGGGGSRRSSLREEAPHGDRGVGPAARDGGGRDRPREEGGDVREPDLEGDPEPHRGRSRRLGVDRLARPRAAERLRLGGGAVGGLRRPAGTPRERARRSEADLVDRHARQEGRGRREHRRPERVPPARRSGGRRGLRGPREGRPPRRRLACAPTSSRSERR